MTPNPDTPRWRIIAVASLIVLGAGLDWPTLILAVAPIAAPALAVAVAVAVVVAWGALFYLRPEDR